ncbi:MAG TPA: DUF2520 domain-containing protein [Actinomycetota bacterium]|nr:DUF2520 domain-containing protein [Actinomycetota bacterium]
MSALNFSLAVAGAGRVATAVGVLLRRRGVEVAAVASRTPSSATRAARFLGAPAVEIAELPPVDVVLIGATDEAIPEVARLVSERVRPGTILWHLSGSLGVGALGAPAGVRRAALHPVQACPDVETAVDRLPGSAWGVTCDAEIDRWCEAVVAGLLDGAPVRVEERDRPVWHAAAVTTANGISALIGAGEALLGGIGIADPVDVLHPLARGSLENARSGGGATLTGPVVRGEFDTVARHLESLARTAPDLVRPYVTAAHLVIDVALRAGRIDERVAARMTELLEGA